MCYGKLSEQKVLSPGKCQRDESPIIIDILNRLNFDFFFFLVHYYFHDLIPNSIKVSAKTDVQSPLHFTRLPDLLSDSDYAICPTGNSIPLSRTNLEVQFQKINF